MPGGLSAYKRVSFGAARACRRSLFGRFEADAQVTKFIVRGHMPALFRIPGRPRLETNSSSKHKRRRPGLFGRRTTLLSGMAFRPESAIYDSQGGARQRLRAIAVECSRLQLSAVDCRRLLLGAVFERQKRDLQRRSQESQTSSCDSSSGVGNALCLLHFKPCSIIGGHNSLW